MEFDIVRIVLRKGVEAICSLAMIRFDSVNVDEAGPSSLRRLYELDGCGGSGADHLCRLGGISSQVMTSLSVSGRLGHNFTLAIKTPLRLALPANCNQNTQGYPA